jgi:esterase/lipase superfamily enzyme
MFMDGYRREFLFNNPIDFTANRGHQLWMLKQQDIILVIGQDDRARWSNEKLTENLWRAAATPCARDGWARWPYWHRMIRRISGTRLTMINDQRSSIIEC